MPCTDLNCAMFKVNDSKTFSFKLLCNATVLPKGHDLPGTNRNEVFYPLLSVYTDKSRFPLLFPLLNDDFFVRCSGSIRLVMEQLFFPVFCKSCRGILLSPLQSVGVWMRSNSSCKSFGQILWKKSMNDSMSKQVSWIKTNVVGI